LGVIVDPSRLKVRTSRYFLSNRVTDWFAVILCAIAFVGKVRWKWNIIPMVLGDGLAGLMSIACNRRPEMGSSPSQSTI
jgi:hypothetical protein